MKLQFLDGSYIEENKSGLIYVGELANEAGHIIRKTKCNLSEFIEAFNEMVKSISNDKNALLKL